MRMKGKSVEIVDLQVLLYSNGLACRKRGRLGLEPVIHESMHVNLIRCLSNTATSMYCYLPGYTGTIDTQCSNCIGAREEETGMSPQHRGHLGVGVADGMIGQDRRPRTGRRKGG